MTTGCVSKACNSKMVENDLVVEKTMWSVRFVTIGRVTVSLPLSALIACFVSAVIFQYDEVNLTVCNVTNSVPSISAITGVTPQRYLWRIFIALHSAPRFIIGYLYWQYYMDRFHQLEDPKNFGVFKLLARLVFWVYVVENACLIGVTYVANVENYPIHEKIFIIFMVTSILYEFLTLIIFSWSHPDMHLTPHIFKSYQIKKSCFVLISAFTAGLLHYFFRHRWYCEQGAFTMFSACEYGIAITNIAFHFTATSDFRNLHWFVGQVTPLHQSNSNNHHKLH